MSKDAWYRKVYGYGLGTGYYYPDGEEVKVGDLVELPNTYKAGTIRIRTGENKPRPYVTWWEGAGGLRTLSLSKVKEFRRWKKERYSNNVPIKKATGPAINYKGKGEVIVGLEDYDHVITMMIK